MSITYYYWGDFTRVGNVGPGLGVYGYPLNGNNNVYNNPSSAPLIATPPQATFAATINAQWQPDDIDRTVLPQFSTANFTNTLGDKNGWAALVCGGLASYNDAFGIAFSTPIADASALTTRFILMPNVHATADGTPSPDPEAVTSNVLLPCPCGPGPFTPTGNTDVKGTVILDPSNFNDYFWNSSVNTIRNYFFILPNAFKQDPETEDWYVDTTVTPFWQGPLTLNPSDGNRRHVYATSNTAPSAFNANLLQAVSPPAASWGMEDLPDYSAIVIPPTNTWVDYNDIVFVPILVARP